MDGCLRSGEYEEFAEADLSELEVEYLWFDAVFWPMRRFLARKDDILAAWAMCRDGSNV